MYGDVMTESMMKAIGETNRRRALQEAYNQAHGITPETVRNAVHEVLEITKKVSEAAPTALNEDERAALMRQVEEEMLSAAKNLEFEQARQAPRPAAGPAGGEGPCQRCAAAAQAGPPPLKIHIARKESDFDGALPSAPGCSVCFHALG